MLPTSSFTSACPRHATPVESMGRTTAAFGDPLRQQIRHLLGELTRGTAMDEVPRA